MRTGRLIVKRTRVLQASPGMESTRGQSQEPQERPRNKRTGTIHGSQDLILARPSGRRSCINVNPELRRSGEGEPK